MDLLGPSNIPPPTDFYVPPGTIPGEVDIEPIPAPDGMVFGGFEKRFIYQGKWHVLIENTYNYDPKTKTLSKSATNSIIRLEDENNILIVAKNLNPDDRDSYSPYIFLKNNDIVIEKNKIWRNSGDSYKNNQLQAFSLSSEGEVWNSFLGRFDRMSYHDKVDSLYIYYYTENLQKVFYETSYNINMPSPPYKEETLMNYPKPSEFGGDSDSWQRKYGLWDSSEAIFFKDYYYVFGGVRDFLEDNPSGTRPASAGSYSTTETTYKRIHKNNNGRINGNWEIITPPWGSRAGGGIPDTRNIKTTEAINKKSFSDDIAVGEAPNNDNVNYMKNEKSSDGTLKIRLSRDGKTLFIAYGYEEGHYYDSSSNRWYQYAIKKYNDIWSTTDGVNWELDTKENLDDAYHYGSIFNYFDDEKHKYVAKIAPTPLEPDWAKSIKNAYYKMDNIYSSIPTPYYEIRDAAERGETNFVLTDEHKNAYNNFLISSVHPDDAEQNDWKALRIHNYTKSSMHWISSPKYLFSFGDKLIRFVDYDSISSYYNGHTSRKRYNELMKEHKLWHKRGEAGGYTTDWREYSQIQCYRQSMYYKAQADLMSELLHGDIKDAYPDEAIRHYVLEFRH